MKNEILSLLLVIILDVVAIFIIFFMAKVMVEFLSKFIERFRYHMGLWDRCLFGRNYFFKFLAWKQKLIDKARSTKNYLLYFLTTRFHYLVGIGSLIYVLINVFSSDDPSARFIKLSENTIAGSVLDLFSFISVFDSTSSLSPDLMSTIIANYLAFLIFIPRYRSFEDEMFLGRFLKYALGIFEIVIFAATTLLFSDIIPRIGFESLNLIPPMFRLISVIPLIICSVCTIVAAPYLLAKAFLLWLKDIVNSIAVFGLLFFFAFIFAVFLGDFITGDGTISFILCILLSQRITDWFFYRFIGKYEDEDDNIIVPRKYIRKQYKKTNLTPPEYYELDDYVY